MKKTSLFIFLTVFTFNAFGWGATGHRAVGYVADQHLSKKARLAIEKILKGQSLAMAGTWMDDIKSDSLYDNTHDWHWVTIQNGETYDQSVKNPKGDLIVTLERLIAELKSKKLNTKQEAEHLKMIVHLIGDIHQPLHVGFGTDQGGNQVKVTWFGGNSNLHRVWDTDMIDGSKLSYTELANAWPKADATRVKSLQQATVRDMAKEAMTFRKQVYSYGDGKLGYDYNYQNFNTVLEQIQKAGIRLAGVLNQIYG
ncbi:MAG TPA: S1/P1 nuclease [Cyclobacteriaceae bacterium]|nr:S1/P1 nuclease [Cyclobacteriaceae bacterium]HMV09898.1 S1/P1 nuclease [Cyclobacteriaceae bacterium]HMV88724.1 S1/P1 nuclease [Cyclobacteriaceae bacterium]HMW99636.1 S1/P1 nuclease [Cyclobacteriaceae bacterium]HMX50987.1 S1/P1 nuclease [Cyclobacteriaceae bacterium]